MIHDPCKSHDRSSFSAILPVRSGQGLMQCPFMRDDAANHAGLSFRKLNKDGQGVDCGGHANGHVQYMATGMYLGESDGLEAICRFRGG